MAMSTHAYVSYAYVIVFGQRQIDIADELPDKAPPGFAELRSEILGFAKEEEERKGLLRVAGMQPASEGTKPGEYAVCRCHRRARISVEGPFSARGKFSFPFFLG